MVAGEHVLKGNVGHRQGPQAERSLRRSNAHAGLGCRYDEGFCDAIAFRQRQEMAAPRSHRNERLGADEVVARLRPDGLGGPAGPLKPARIDMADGGKMRLILRKKRQEFLPLALPALLRNRFCKAERGGDGESDRRVAARQFFEQQRIQHCRLRSRVRLGLGDGLGQSQLPHRRHDRCRQFRGFVRRAGGRRQHGAGKAGDRRAGDVLLLGQCERNHSPSLRQA
jgi:hypothetical protein